MCALANGLLDVTERGVTSEMCAYFAGIVRCWGLRGLTLSGHGRFSRTWNYLRRRDTENRSARQVPNRRSVFAGRWDAFAGRHLEWRFWRAVLAWPLRGLGRRWRLRGLAGRGSGLLVDDGA